LRRIPYQVSPHRPISQQILDDHDTAEDDITYEKAEILFWFKLHKNVISNKIVPNINIKNIANICIK
jgi:hypothetical protein